MGYMGRDVEITDVDDQNCLVGACDSCGAVGSKKLDEVPVPAELVGQLTARVALMEVVAAGARPVMMTVCVCAEPEPTGRDILTGVRQETASAGYPDLPLVVSTEKNFTTCQTGLGIGVTGICRKTDLRLAGSRAGDRIYTLGLPRVGGAVARSGELLTAAHVSALLAVPEVRDVVPVGSRGIAAEILSLAQNCDTVFVPVPDPVPDMDRSGGPSTCAVFTASAFFVPSQLPVSFAGMPLHEVGCLIPASDAKPFSPNI